MAADTLAAMDAAGVTAADVVGVSMGARIAIELCLAHLERVRSLTLIGGRPTGRSNLTRLLAKAATVVERDGGHGLRRQREAGNGYDVTRRLPRVRVRTLVLHGRRDRLVPLTSSRELARLIPGAELDLMPGAISASCAHGQPHTPSASTRSQPQADPRTTSSAASMCSYWLGTSQGLAPA